MKKIVKLFGIMTIAAALVVSCKPTNDPTNPDEGKPDSGTNSEAPATPGNPGNDATGGDGGEGGAGTGTGTGEAGETVTSPVILFKVTTDYKTDAHCKVLFEVSELEKYKNKTNAKVVFTTTGGIDSWGAGSWGHFFGCTNKNDCYNTQSGDKLELVGGTVISSPIADVLTAFENSDYVSCNLWSTELVKIEVIWE